MNQQLVKYTEADKIQDYNGDSITWFTSMLDVKKNHILGAAISEKELKIRGELEMEVERDLEEEIKDGICNLSLRLHRLYQRQKERQQEKEASSDNNKTKALSELNISIKMEGKTKVEIKETKKEEVKTDHQKGHRRRRSMTSRTHRSSSEDMKQEAVCNDGLNNNEKKVDWEKTLRAGSSGRTVSVNKSSNRESDKGKANNEGRRSSSRRVKRQGKVDCELLQLGWKF